MRYYHLISLIIKIKKKTYVKKKHNNRKYNGGCQWGGRMGSYCLMDGEFQFYKIKSIMGMDHGDGLSPMWIYLIPLDSVLKNG